MRTPREVLLSRHRDAEPRLDAIRRRVVSALGESTSAPPAGEREGVSLLATCWQELFVSCRRYWAGLGVAWALVAMLMVGGAFKDSGGAAITRANESMRQAMHAQLELRDELLGVAAVEKTRTAPANTGPRSDLHQEERYV